MKFETIRLMLSERDQGDLFSRREDRLASEYMFDSREKWLRSTFADTIYFQHRTVIFAYVPDKENSGVIVVGQIGRPRTVRENSPPESGFIPTTREAWKAADFLLDAKSHADGQKVALAEDSTVASPLPLMKSLAAAINARIPPEPYLIEANGITDPETFFQFIRENPNDVTTVSFELVVPNMFGIRNELDEEMRQLRDNEKAKKAKIVLQSQDGLVLDTERVRQTAAYTAEGGGNIFARTRSGKRFSSRSRGKSVSVAQLGDAEERPGLIARVIGMVFRQ